MWTRKKKWQRSLSNVLVQLDHSIHTGKKHQKPEETKLGTDFCLDTMRWLLSYAREVTISHVSMWDQTFVLTWVCGTRHLILGSGFSGVGIVTWHRLEFRKWQYCWDRRVWVVMATLVGWRDIGWGEGWHDSLVTDFKSLTELMHSAEQFRASRTYCQEHLRLGMR